MNAARVTPVKADAFIMRTLCKAKCVPTERGAKGKDKTGWRGVRRYLKISSSFVQSSVSSALGCSSGRAEGGQEMKGADVGTSKPCTTELHHSRFGG